MEMKQPQFNFKPFIHNLVNIDVLIELVKESPVIWDKTVEGYRNKDISILAWDQIFRTLFPDTYDKMGEEQQKWIGKVIKQKWTTARDIWQRNHKKRKEAIQNGENFADLRDYPRYEQLMFLAKVYDADDNFQTGEEDKMQDLNLARRPISPQVDFDEENVLNNNVDFQRQFMSMLNKQGLTQSSQKIKLEDSDSSNAQPRIEQASSAGSPFKPVVVNVEDRYKVKDLISASKRRASSTESGEPDKSSFNPNQIFKSEQKNSCDSKEEMTISASNKTIKTSSNYKKLKLTSRSSQSPKHRNQLKPSSSKDKSTKPNTSEMDDCKREINETRVEQASTTNNMEGEKSSNTELDQFLQVLRSRIDDFNKAQVMDFLFEILKPHIKDLNKHQLLDFQIEALQLVKKIQRN